MAFQWVILTGLLLWAHRTNAYLWESDTEQEDQWKDNTYLISTIAIAQALNLSDCWICGKQPPSTNFPPYPLIPWEGNFSNPEWADMDRAGISTWQDNPYFKEIVLSDVMLSARVCWENPCGIGKRFLGWQPGCKLTINATHLIWPNNTAVGAKEAERKGYLPWNVSAPCSSLQHPYVWQFMEGSIGCSTSDKTWTWSHNCTLSCIHGPSTGPSCSYINGPTYQGSSMPCPEDHHIRKYAVMGHFIICGTKACTSLPWLWAGHCIFGGVFLEPWAFITRSELPIVWTKQQKRDWNSFWQGATCFIGVLTPFLGNFFLDHRINQLAHALELIANSTAEDIGLLQEQASANRAMKIA